MLEKCFIQHYAKNKKNNGNKEIFPKSKNKTIIIILKINPPPS